MLTPQNLKVCFSICNILLTFFFFFFLVVEINAVYSAFFSSFHLHVEHMCSSPGTYHGRNGGYVEEKT